MNLQRPWFRAEETKDSECKLTVLDMNKEEIFLTVQMSAEDMIEISKMMLGVGRKAMRRSRKWFRK